ncbi:MAG TPA: response regulator [Rhodanobacter sp.]
MPSQSAALHLDPAPPSQPRVLVADDDPASCRFLCDGVSSLGGQAVACTDGLTALQRAGSEAFDLLLLDCRMPGAGALQILTRLRADTRALSTESLAVATTAELAPRDRQALLAAGFSQILLKPCGLVDLQRILALVPPACQDAPVLDDRAALTATGDATTMRALRLLLREELALLQQELDQLSKHHAGFDERLHRLRSSCGFCGAHALSSQAALMQRQLSRHEATPAALARFRKALLMTLRALDR